MELQGAYPQIRAEGAELLAVSVDGLEDARLMAEHAGAQFPVLSDSAQAVARAYGIFNLLGDNLAAPAAFVIGRNGELLGQYVGQDIGDRVPTAAVLEFLRNPPER